MTCHTIASAKKISGDLKYKYPLHYYWSYIGSGAHGHPSNITEDGNTVERVDNFIYLGSTQSSNGGSQTDIMRRIALASSVMSSLQQVWKDRYLSLPTKIRVYEMLVLPVLLYACETWTILAADERRLEAFHMK